MDNFLGGITGNSVASTAIIFDNGANHPASGSIDFYVSGSNKLAMHIHKDGNVGIGQTVPAAALHLTRTVDGEATLLKLQNDEEGASTAAGIMFLLPRSGGHQFPAGEIIVTKENGTWTGAPGTIDSVMTFKVILSESSGTAMTIGSDKEIHGNFDDTSDRSLKENIEELSTTLEKVNLLKPSSFNWKASSGRNDKNQIGFIAQEVEEQFEELVSASKVDGEEIKSINTIGLVAVLTKAVKELSAKVEALENN